jgi:hypothetical protein
MIIALGEESKTAENFSSLSCKASRALCWSISSWPVKLDFDPPDFSVLLDFAFMRSLLLSCKQEAPSVCIDDFPVIVEPPFH